MQQWVYIDLGYARLRLFRADNGGSPGFKSFGAYLSADHFLDESGAVHQDDVLATLKATLRDQLSFTIGPQNGDLRSYATEAPGKLGCNDPNLPRTSYRGLPYYHCGESEEFDLVSVPGVNSACRIKCSTLP